MKSILIIDDEVDICHLLSRFLQKKGFKAEGVFSGKAGLKYLKKDKVDLILCDFRLPDIEGYELISQLKSLDPEVKIIVITGYSDVKTAVKVVRMGAADYVTKPIHREEILLSIQKALGRKKAVSSSSTKKNHNKKQIIEGNSLAAQQVTKMIQLIAPTDMSVIIEGESGTGKEMAARRIHELSTRKNGPFIAVDCGAIPRELASSELFGHVKGAFTGALTNKIGHFENAHKGTLFLDEIGNLSYENQIQLLRVIQERKVQKVGGTETVAIDIRLIVATNENLKEAARSGEFREDLYFRLNEFKIELPALRERKEDIPSFVNYFVERSNSELGKSLEGLDADTLQVLQSYYWHGNIRELKNVIKRAVLMATRSKLSVADLPLEIAVHDPSQDDVSVPVQWKGVGLKNVIEKTEQKVITEAMQLYGSNKSKVARELQIDRKTLYAKLKQYGITE